jgi:hypothetical protein
MNRTGSGLLIAILAVVVAAALAAFLFFFKASAAPAPPGAARRGPHLGILVTCARTPTGIKATVTVTNDGTETLRNVRITRVSAENMSGGPTAPIVLGRVARGATSTFTVPFTGAPPPPNAPLVVRIDRSYDFGWFGSGSGSGSSEVTSLVP